MSKKSTNASIGAYRESQCNFQKSDRALRREKNRRFDKLSSKVPTHLKVWWNCLSQEEKDNEISSYEWNIETNDVPFTWVEHLSASEKKYLDESGIYLIEKMKALLNI